MIRYQIRLLCVGFLHKTTENCMNDWKEISRFWFSFCFKTLANVPKNSLLSDLDGVHIIGAALDF